MNEEELYQEYLRTVMRCADGRPAIDFRFWCWQRGINLGWIM